VGLSPEVLLLLRIICDSDVELIRSFNITRSGIVLGLKPKASGLKWYRYIALAQIAAASFYFFL
jgi:hypothetical protein